MAVPPQVTKTYEELPTESTSRREAMLELFGEHLFCMRNTRLALLERLLTDSAVRESLLGTIQRKPFETVASQGTAAVTASLDLARAALDFYIHDVMALFTNLGSDLRFGARHSIRYRLLLEVVESDTLELVEEQTINRDTVKAIVSYFGRWLNKYGSATAINVKPPNTPE